MREPADIGKITDLRETILRDYRMKTADLGYDETRYEAAVQAIRALGYELWMARQWLSSGPHK